MVYGASGNVTVPTEDMLDLAETICSNTAAAVNELRAGFLAGGEAAAAAATAMLQAYVGCEDGEDAFSTVLTALRGGLNGADRGPMDQMLSAIAEAFDHIGWAICLTSEVEDLRTGDLSDERFFHTTNSSEWAPPDVAEDVPKVWTWYTLGLPGGCVQCTGFDEINVAGYKVEDETPHRSTGGVSLDANDTRWLATLIYNNTNAAVHLIWPMVSAGGSEAEYAASAFKQAHKELGCRSTIYDALNGLRALANPPPFADSENAALWATNVAAAFDAVDFPICLTVATAHRDTNARIDQEFYYTGAQESS